MSEEEKKAIEDLKKTIDYYDKKFKDNERITSVLVDNFDVNNLYILLNLVKKQQEEIDRLKIADENNSKLIANMSTRHFNDRTKIRKYEEEIEKKDKMYRKEYNEHMEKKRQNGVLINNELILKREIEKKDLIMDLILNTFIDEVELDRYYKVYENMTIEDLKQYFQNKVEGSK